MQDLEHMIRERAYHLWQESGCQEGTADAHWLAAQREILDASLTSLGRVSAAMAKPKKAKASRKKRAA